MSTLKNYVDRKNTFNTMFKRPMLSLDVASDRQRIADMIDCDLSPEHLTCDGELPRAEVNRRYRELTSAAKELKALDPTIRFHEFI
jgi:hypothetical protein